MEVALLESFMRQKTCGTYEVLLYIGSKEGYDGNSFTEEDLLREVGLFQDAYSKSLPLRVSRCLYIAGSKYREEGWELSAIMYPNHLRNKDEIDKFMEALGSHLMQAFKQNRITLRKIGNPATWPPNWDRGDTIMFESEAAEVSRSIQNFNKAQESIKVSGS